MPPRKDIQDDALWQYFPVHYWPGSDSTRQYPPVPASTRQYPPVPASTRQYLPINFHLTAGLDDFLSSLQVAQLEGANALAKAEGCQLNMDLTTVQHNLDCLSREHGEVQGKGHNFEEELSQACSIFRY